MKWLPAFAKLAVLVATTIISAIITAARINGELEKWMATGEVEFKMVG